MEQEIEKKLEKGRKTGKPFRPKVPSEPARPSLPWPSSPLLPSGPLARAWPAWPNRRSSPACPSLLPSARSRTHGQAAQQDRPSCPLRPPFSPPPCPASPRRAARPSGTLGRARRDPAPSAAVARTLRDAHPSAPHLRLTYSAPRFTPCVPACARTSRIIGTP